MIRLSAFADEISPDLDQQIAVLQSENIRHVDLRGVWDTNVLDLSDEQVEHIKRALDAAGIRVAAIGSPIGKVSINSSFDDHQRRFERAIAVARFFQAPYIRIFSFYPPGSAEADGNERGDPAAYRDDVLARLRELTARARAAGLILLHENEKDIYGDTAPRSVDLMRSIDDDHFQAAFDPANFIQCGEVPYPDAYASLSRWVRYVHVKDALVDGSVVPAGDGAACWPDLLRQLREDGYDGFFSLEPHLAEAEQFRGFSGPDLFARASRALHRLLREMNWEAA